MGSQLLWVVPLATGCILALVLTPVARRVATHAGDVDRPLGNKIHSTATPLMGGVAVYLAFVVASLMVLPLSHPVLGVLLGGGVAVAVGVLDEFLTLKPVMHLAGQCMAGCVAIVAGVGVIGHVSVPWGSVTTPGFTLPLVFGLPLTIFWLVGMMNTVNFLDGLDGLAAGVCALAALMLAVWASEPGRFALPATVHHEDLYLPLAMAGALLGFLPYNWHRASIFLGDSGAMFLGLTLAALSIVGPAKLATALLVLLIPVLDVAWAIVRRRLQGRSFMSQDKQHVYHRMLELGMGHAQVVVALYVLCLALAGLDLLVLKIAKLVAFVVLAAAALGAFVILDSRAARRSTKTSSVASGERAETSLPS